MTIIGDQDAVLRFLGRVRDNNFLSVNADWEIDFICADVPIGQSGRPDEAVGQNLWEFLFGLKGSRFQHECLQAFETQTAKAFDDHVPLFNRWMRVRLFPSPDGLSVLAHDITARKRAENSLYRITELDHGLARALDRDGVVQCLIRIGILLPADWVLVDVVGPGGEVERLGVGHTDPAQTELAELLRQVPPQLSDPENSIAEVLRTHEPCFSPDCLEKAWSDSTGGREAYRRVAPRSGIVAPLVARGRTLGALTLLRCQEHPRLDDDDLSLATEIANHAALALDNVRLLQEATDAAQARDVMVSVVSHDLRNPLNTIQLVTHTLLELIPDQPERMGERNSLGAIGRATEHMNRLIQDLLDVTRIQSGRLTVTPRPELPAELIAEALEMLAASASERGITLESSTAQDLPMVTADRQRIIQLFSNLIGNALKFTPRGGSIRIGAEAGPDEVRFFVRDSGLGISDQHLAHLFDRFWQADRKDRRGLGLGLAIAKGIAEAHGGTIWAESVPGAGSTFSFTLPRAVL